MYDALPSFQHPIFIYYFFNFLALKYFIFFQISILEFEYPYFIKQRIRDKNVNQDYALTYFSKGKKYLKALLIQKKDN